jgi:Lrp/AsnC family leucine-responsive transcriptional regulator
VALLNPEKLNLQLTIFVLVGLNSHDTKKMASFEQTIRSSPEVMQCYLITGHTADYILKVIVSDLKEYQSFLLNKLTKIEGVSQVHSSFALNTIVDKTELSLNHLK